MEHDGREARRTDRSRPDGPRQRRLARVPPELRAEQVHDAGFLRGREHAPALGGVAREGLFADHVLARGDRGERELGVRVRGRGDRHRIDAFERERVVERRERERHVELAGARFRAFAVATDHRQHVEARGAQRANVRNAAETGSDHHDAERRRTGVRHVPRGVIPAAT